MLVSASTLPLVLLSGTLLLRNAMEEVERTEQMVRDRVALLAEDVDREIARLAAAAEVLAVVDELSNGDLAAFYGIAVQVRDRLGTNVVVRDRSNQQVLNTRVPWGSPLPVNSGFEADRRAIDTLRPQVSGLIVGALLQAPILIVVVPVVHQGTVRHLLSLTIDQRHLQGLLTGGRLPPGWIAGITDADGVIIGRSARAAEVVGTRVPDATWNRITHAPEGIHRIADLEGNRTVQSYRLSRSSGWLVGVSVPETLLAASARQTILLFSVGGLALVLLSLLGAVLFGRRIARPAAQLASAAAALGSGQRITPLVQGIVELEAVSTALQVTSDLVQARTAALIASEAQARQAASHIRESEGRLAHFIENAPAGIVMFDQNMRYLSASRRFITDHRVDAASTSDLIGRSHYEVFPDVPQPWRDVHARVLSGETAQCEAERYWRADGGVDWVSWRMEPWYDSAGAVGGALLFAEVITARKEAEEALRQSEERIRLGAQVAGFGTFEVDPATGRWTWLPELYDLLGVSRDAGLTYERLLALCHADDRARVAAGMGAVLAPDGQNEAAFDCRVNRPDGQIRWFHAKLQVFQGSGRRIVGVLQDVTGSRRAVAEALQARMAMLHAARLSLIGAVATTIAHEVNQPIGAASNYLQFAQAVAGDDKLGTVIGRAREQLARALTTMRKVRAFAAKRELELRSERVAPLLDEACTLALPGDLRDGLRISVSVPECLEPALIDRVQIQQVLVNLIRNAAEAVANAPDKEIEISVAAQPDESMIEIAVADSGPGIAEEIRPRLFSPFSTTKPDGTGLGLSTSRAIVEAHGGRLWTDTNAVGAVFRLTVPVAKRHADV
ncbi:ATP-binding protein [Azospirillum sp.]|uniref:ATP-binding protein n=1 Tax=Azospirillum sp. TaxID=34012 RepID=UPI003D7500A6